MVLKGWLSMHFYDFEEDDVLIRSLISFIDTEMGDSDLANDLRLLIQDKVYCEVRLLLFALIPFFRARNAFSPCLGLSLPLMSSLLLSRRVYLHSLTSHRLRAVYFCTSNLLTRGRSPDFLRTIMPENASTSSVSTVHHPSMLASRAVAAWRHACLSCLSKERTWSSGWSESWSWISRTPSASAASCWPRTLSRLSIRTPRGWISEPIPRCTMCATYVSPRSPLRLYVFPPALPPPPPRPVCLYARSF